MDPRKNQQQGFVPYVNLYPQPNNFQPNGFPPNNFQQNNFPPNNFQQNNFQTNDFQRYPAPGKQRKKKNNPQNQTNFSDPAPGLSISGVPFAGRLDRFAPTKFKSYYKRTHREDAPFQTQQTGPPHCPSFSTVVRVPIPQHVDVSGFIVGQGQAKTKKESILLCSMNALDKLAENGLGIPDSQPYGTLSGQTQQTYTVPQLNLNASPQMNNQLQNFPPTMMQQNPPSPIKAAVDLVPDQPIENFQPVIKPNTGVAPHLAGDFNGALRNSEETAKFDSKVLWSLSPQDQDKYLTQAKLYSEGTLDRLARFKWKNFCSAQDTEIVEPTYKTNKTEDGRFYSIVSIPIEGDWTGEGYGLDEKESEIRAAMFSLKLVENLGKFRPEYQFDQTGVLIPPENQTNTISVVKAAKAVQVVELFVDFFSLPPVLVTCMPFGTQAKAMFMYEAILKLPDTDDIRVKEQGITQKEAQSKAYQTLYYKLAEQFPTKIKLLDQFTANHIETLNKNKAQSIPSLVLNIKSEVVQEIVEKLEKFPEGSLRSIPTTFETKQEPTLAFPAIVFANSEPDSLKLLEGHHGKINNPIYYNTVDKSRRALPIAKHKQEILDSLENNQVIIVSGPTGTGKTTQIPQYIFEDLIEKGRGSTCRMAVTSPRRISAISVATRVAYERHERVGDNIGFKIRLEANPGKYINFVTSGIMLRMFNQTFQLGNFTHIIVDEIHGRDLYTDFLLVLLKKILESNKSIKIVLMSATLDEKKFSEYFYNCPVVHVEGETFPVEIYHMDEIYHFCSQHHFVSPALTNFQLEQRMKSQYGDSMQIVPESIQEKRQGKNKNLLSSTKESTLEIDYQLISHLVFRTIQASTTREAVLIFLPGYEEIKKCMDNIFLYWGEFQDQRRFEFIILHSSVSMKNQQRVFTDPGNLTRIILATNIAESAITVDNVTTVIDCGLMKLKMTNSHVSSTTFGPVSETATFAGLVLQNVSKANATQRKGRVGRNSKGVCYRLYSKSTADKFDEFETPEMIRLTLDSVCLQVISMNLGNPIEFLETTLEPPPKQNIEIGLKKLQLLGALDEDWNLTHLGKRLSVLPCEPSQAKMIVLGCAFKCLDSMLTISSGFQLDIFSSDPSLKNEVRKSKFAFSKAGSPESHFSDHLTLLSVFNHWWNIPSEEWVMKNFLNSQTLRQISSIKKLQYDVLVNTHLINVNDETKQLNELYNHDYTNRNLTVLHLLNQPVSNESRPWCDVSHYSKERGNLELVKACMSASCYPNIARVSRKKKTCFTKVDNSVVPAFNSALYLENSLQTRSPFFLFEEKTMSKGKMQLRNVSNVSVISLLLLSGAWVEFLSEINIIVFDDTHFIKVNKETCFMLEKLNKITSLCLNQYYQKPDDPETQNMFTSLLEIFQLIFSNHLCENS